MNKWISFRENLTHEKFLQHNGLWFCKKFCPTKNTRCMVAEPTFISEFHWCVWWWLSASCSDSYLIMWAIASCDSEWLKPLLLSSQKWRYSAGDLWWKWVQLPAVMTIFGHNLCHPIISTISCVWVVSISHSHLPPLTPSSPPLPPSFLPFLFPFSFIPLLSLSFSLHSVPFFSHHFSPIISPPSPFAFPFFFHPSLSPFLPPSLPPSPHISHTVKDRPEISSPVDFEHTVHVGFDPNTGEFTVSNTSTQYTHKTF